MSNSPPRFSVSISLLFRDLPFNDRFAAAKDAGFDAVEIQLIEEVDASSAAAARRADIDVVLLNVSLADFRTGGAALSGVPGRERAFHDAFDQAAVAADELEATFLHLGPSRVPTGVSRQACLDVYRRNLSYAAERSRGHRVKPVIEPLNTVETPDILLSSLDEADALCTEVGDAIGMQYDLYHATLNGVDLVHGFDRHRDRIRHIQFADAPGRHEPGTGAVAFSTVLPHVAASGYRGHLGAEYFPSQPGAPSFPWLAHFRHLVRS